MSIWKQLLLSGLVLAAAALGAAVWLPQSHPFLAQIGLLDPITRLGLVPQADAAEDGRPGGGPGGPGGGGPGGGRPGGPTVVVAVAPQSRVMNDIVTAICAAARSVSLAAEVPGRLVALNVASGDYVTEGTLVAELDRAAAQIALDRAALVAADAQETRDRMARLQNSGAVTEMQMREADLALATADLALREAEFDLSRHRIVAPISGWAGILPADVGNPVAAGDEIARIEDRSSLIVDFRVPERVVSHLAPGTPLRAAPLAAPGADLDGAIAALDNRVDETSRTLLVRAGIGNADDRLRPGMAFRITLTFSGDRHPAVDPLSIQWGNDGAYVWAVREGRALKLPVRILQRSTDAVLIDAAFAPGDAVVTEGVQTLREGAEVTVLPAAGTAGAAAPGSKT
jgi:RND family efflux transporter MFP subunit